MVEIKTGRGYVYMIRYLIVWCVKCQRKALRDRIETDLQEIFRVIADDHNFTIVDLIGGADHVHFLVECMSQHYLPDMLKGISARRLFERHLE